MKLSDIPFDMSNLLFMQYNIIYHYLHTYYQPLDIHVPRYLVSPISIIITNCNSFICCLLIYVTQ